mmetsp:Transcript_33671/g.28436  ORF Transcript_33671/g.28436 Transcript_33671/m.28436 type:complete len:145 (-) Transcript_33671:142-576(-)
MLGNNLIESNNVKEVSLQVDEQSKNTMVYIIDLNLNLKIISKSESETKIPSLFQNDIISISSGILHSCAIKSISGTSANSGAPSLPGDLGCWGNNNFGQAAIPSSFATQILSTGLGNFHTCAVSVRMLVCWGNNKYGQTTVPKQ